MTCQSSSNQVRGSNLNADTLTIMFTSGVSISPGTSNELGVRVEIMTVSSDTLSNYPDDPEKRNCYLNEDVSFQAL